MPSRAAVAAPPAGERLVKGAERLLRVIGDARTGLALLLLAGVANALAALLPDGPARLDGLPYAILLGAVALTGRRSRRRAIADGLARVAASNARAGRRGHPAAARRGGHARRGRAIVAGGRLPCSARGAPRPMGRSRRAPRLVAIRGPRQPPRPGGHRSRRRDRRGVRIGDGLLPAARRPGAARRPAERVRLGRAPRAPRRGVRCRRPAAAARHDRHLPA